MRKRHKHVISKLIFALALLAIAARPLAAAGDPVTDYTWYIKPKLAKGEGDWVRFESHESACSWAADNYCSIISGSTSSTDKCVSFTAISCNVDTQFASGLLFGKMQFYPEGSNELKERTNTFSIWGERKKYSLADVIDNPPPNVCVGDPIEVSTGRLYEKEVDIPAAGEGQVEFARVYDSKHPQNVWSDTYATTATTVQTVDVSQAEKFRFNTAPISTTRDRICDPWMGVPGLVRHPGAPWDPWVPSNIKINGNFCQVTNGNSVKRNLIFMRVNPYVLIDNPDLRETIQISRPDGSLLTFQKTGSKWISNIGSTAVITLDQNKNWVYMDRGVIEEYSPSGKLLSKTARNGIKQTLVYDAAGQLSKVLDSTGKQLVFGYLNGKLRRITTGDNKVTTYEYNSLGLISGVIRTDNTRRSYLYEDIRHPKALTAIVDERGTRYVTWTYDAKGRATSSENAGNVERTLLVFNVDGSTTVTNALNKQTIYRFDDIAGARRVVKVEGQPTANCLGANQDYTYTPEGWIASKTDWKGIKTTFTYNTLGQEISRTEAFGTPEARTIATEWHPTLFVKTKITEPEKETVYSYDANGRLLNQSTQSISVQ